MSLSTVFPIMVMSMMFIASIPYFFTQDYGRAIYWFAGGLLNFSIIFLIK